MNRFRRYLGFTAILALFGAMGAGAAELLSDDFTDLAASHVLGWRNQSPDQMPITVASGGGYVFDNSANGGYSEYLYAFSGSKPSTFTLSFVLKSVEGNTAGALFCRQANSTGYLLTTSGSSVIVYTLTASGNSIELARVFDKASDHVSRSDNTLAVSKSGSDFHIFVNGSFVGNFTDATYGSGDLSFFMYHETKAVFGAVRVTDAFTPGQKATEFVDSFDGSSLGLAWQSLSAGGPVPEVGVANGKLKMKTAEGGAAWRFIDFDLTEFEAKVEVSHLSGKSATPYGIILLGANTNTQAANFAILGSGQYAVWTAPSTSYTPAPSSKILGAGVGGVTFTDTIEIKKKAGSSAYEFYANGELLMASTDVNFKITGIGLFAYGDVELAFDNFYVKETSTPTSIRHDVGKRISRKPVIAAKNAPQAFYDLRGRKRYTLTAAQSSNRATIRRAAGVYVNENGREIHIRGKR